ncbi:MAG TPA: dihydrofolate reductase [Steroidobacteraceae bacterium]|jgi:dihydrofolate reductase|nr:dihydrofolate reductase [Steroidobacteraceae bacterium]
MTRLSAVVAVSDNDVIGRDNALPWHLPADLQHFKRLTLGKPMLMGRRTFESIGRPLPGRRSLVLTRSADFAPPGIEVCHTLEQALAAVADQPELMVIGGAALFALTLPAISRVYLTRVHATVQGEVLLPPLDPAGWRETQREERAADAANPIALSFITLDRVPPGH